MKITSENVKAMLKMLKELMGKAIEKFFTVLVFVLMFVGAIIYIFGANPKQEAYAHNLQMDNFAYLKYACHSKSVCKTYAEARVSCAAAGNIDRCIDIKMQGEVYYYCRNDGNAYWMGNDVKPNFAQCFGNSIITFLQPN